MRHDIAMKACHCLTRLLYFYTFYSHRGDSFRTEFSHLGELRSIIPEAVKVIALTATATKASRREIIRSLDVQKPELITVPPVKHNIIYAVAKKSSIALAFVPPAKKMAEQTLSMGRTIIFCRRYDEVTGIYHFFRRSLGEGFTEPPGAPDMDRFGIVDMFTHCTHDSVKATIMSKFTMESSLAVVIATIAFGMGIDSPDVRQIIHWGVPDDAEMYTQESGRAGCDGETSCALIVYGQNDVRKGHTTDHMARFFQNEDQCRKKIFF